MAQIKFEGSLSQEAATSSEEAYALVQIKVLSNLPNIMIFYDSL
jgi:hypothetical protein